MRRGRDELGVDPRATVGIGREDRERTARRRSAASGVYESSEICQGWPQQIGSGTSRCAPSDAMKGAVESTNQRMEPDGASAAAIGVSPRCVGADETVARRS